ncbi:MAG: siderophore-interacting protein [Burkholderiaceae bacterium]
MNSDALSGFTVERLRHPLHIRRLQVQHVERISPHFFRLRLAGQALDGFVSASFDDHLKLMLPARPGAALVLPEMGPDGPVLPPGVERPVMRDYTPRHFDAAAQTLDIECFVHASGPATEWASQARSGDPVGVGGPRGSFVVPMAFGCHVLIGDESAMPAIADADLRNCPPAPRPLPLWKPAILQTAHGTLPGRFADRVVPAGTVDGLAKAGRAGAARRWETFAWAAGEAASMVAVRQAGGRVHGLHKSRVRVSAYWKRGSAGHHENLVNARTDRILRGESSAGGRPARRARPGRWIMPPPTHYLFRALHMPHHRVETANARRAADDARVQADGQHAGALASMSSSVDGRDHVVREIAPVNE